MADSSSVQVAVRVRPMLASESGSTKCIEVLKSDPNQPEDVVRIGGESGPSFTFDQVFDGSTHQSFVFENRVAPLVQSCLEGYNATVLAYGQTGSGKTHTIMGPSTALQDGEMAGVIPRALTSLFEKLAQENNNNNNNNSSNNSISLTRGLSSVSGSTVQDDDTLDPSDRESIEVDPGESSDSEAAFEVRLQFLEIYGEEIRDLLTTKPSAEKLTIRDVGMEEPEVLGATQHRIESAEEALLCLSRGMLRRVTGETAMNAASSRSHAILSLMVEQTSTSSDGHTGVKRSKFNFVDLAGSERQKRTKAEGQRLKEGIDINKGLLVLGNVISALGDPKKQKKAFVPYRDSKLTRLLKGSLGGNHKTLMVACVSPSSNNMEESLNCLRYANRAKNIQNNAVVNVDAGSRLVVELKGRLAALAGELLRVRNGEKPNEETFSKEVLEKLASETETGWTANFPPTGTSSGPQRRITAGSSDEQVGRLQADLRRTQEALERKNEDLRSTSEDLFTVLAEKEMYRLRNEHQGGASDLEASFLEKAAAYEREIAALKEAVQATPMAVESEVGRIQEASQLLDRDKAQLAAIQNQLANMVTPPPKETPSSTTANNDRSTGSFDSPEVSDAGGKLFRSISQADQIAAEEEAEQAELSTMTDRYLNEVDKEDDEQNGVPELEAQEDEEEKDESIGDTKQQIEANIRELSKSIEEKENLIEQLVLSQQKYAKMREFYEQKLREMEDQLREREAEHEDLAREIQKLGKEKGGAKTSGLQKKLKEKELQISQLRKRQGEFAKLTRISSRNESEIGRLKNEILGMKQRKVELQRLISAERKNHLGEIQRLKKVALQSDRQATKWKRMSDRKTREAERAQLMAKARLEQMGQLKAKYKEAERKIRVRTVKRGVMEKAGLDAVIVGRRNTAGRATGIPTKIQSSNGGSTPPEADVDSIRDFLDQKVVDVGLMEVIANKLANEWEDHLMLISKKEDMLGAVAGGDTDITSESIDAVDVQLKYKQERIRQLAKRLGRPQSGGEKPIDFKESILDDKGFKELVPDGFTSIDAAQLASRVLFGMVVRERRRVATLARTASTLDEKAVEAEKAAAAKDAAFRSFMEEERHERATLAQTQQEQILSLMEMVHDNEGKEQPEHDDIPQDDQLGTETGKKPSASQNLAKGTSSRVMILANERIQALEQQLQELRGEKETKDLYKEREAEVREGLKAKEEECDKLHKELNQMRSSLRQIREAVTRHTIGSEYGDDKQSDLTKSILEIVMSSLHPSRSGLPPRAKGRKSPPAEAKLGAQPKVVSTRLKRHVELMHTSDSEEDEDIPDWANDIMADLAVIAEGHIPDTLLQSPTFKKTATPTAATPATATPTAATPKKEPERRDTNVFERLNNPENFTGVQKRKATPVRQRPQTPSQAQQRDRRPKPSKNQREDRKALVQRTTISLENMGTPDSSTTKSADPPPEDRSVFERLGSPSAYTGTQKDKLHARKVQQGDSMGDEKDKGTVRKSSHTDAPYDERVANDPDSGARTDSTASESHSAQQETSKKAAGYTQQNVFERLQKTTTHAYAERHKTAKGAPSLSHHPSQESDPAATKQGAEGTPTSPIKEVNYAKQSVFVRLRRGTNHGMARRKAAAATVTARLAASESSLSPEPSDYTNKNVFERLQKTTTQSYSKHYSSGKNHDEM